MVDDIEDAFDQFDRSWAERQGVFERRTIGRELELVVMPARSRWRDAGPSVAVAMVVEQLLDPLALPVSGVEVGRLRRLRPGEGVSVASAVRGDGIGVADVVQADLGVGRAVASQASTAGGGRDGRGMRVSASSRAEVSRGSVRPRCG
jgi:hypothetical protein